MSASASDLETGRLFKIENKDDACILRRYAAPVSFPLSSADERLIHHLQAQHNQLGGVGLAAPQIGYSRQIVIVEINQQAAAVRGIDIQIPAQVMINPRYEPILDSQQTLDWEGCFSVDSIIGKVPRFDAITVQYQTMDGQWHDETLSGFHARVVQHEIDHIRGTLIVDRLTQDQVHGDPEIMMEQRLSEMSAEQRAIAEFINPLNSNKEN